MKTELFARGTNYLEEDAASEARADRWLNDAYREILNLHAWPFLEAEATGAGGGVGYVALTDLRKIRFVFNISTTPPTKLARISLDDLVGEDTIYSRAGTPAYYYVENNSATEMAVTAYPVGGQIKVWYYKRVADLSGSDEPLFDEQYHNLIVDKAMIMAYNDSDNFEAADRLNAQVNVRLAAMAEDYMLNSRELEFVQVDPYDG